LYSAGQIEWEIALYFAIAQITFWIAFLIPIQEQISFSDRVVIDENRVADYLFAFFLIVYFTLTIISYSIFGIPLWKESRLETYAGSGLGIFARILPFAQVYCIFYSYFIWKKLNKFGLKKFIVMLSFIFFLITGILSGSRSSFFIFLFVFWGYHYFYLRNVYRIKEYYKFLVLGLIISVFSFVIKSETLGIFDGLFGFALRVVSSGDNYYMALPNNVWEDVVTGQWYNHLFLGLLGPLRIISAVSAPPPVGYQLVWILNPSIDGLATGPLSSPALLGWLYFRWGGIVFSFLLGFFVSCCIYKIPRLIPNGLLSSIFITYFYMQMLSFIQDATLGMTFLFDSILNFVMFVTLIICIFRLITIDGEPVD
jgi:hypothetical protein